MSPTELLDAALPFVESESIRSWATSDHNRPIFVQIAQKALDGRGPTGEPRNFAAYIVCLAIGLI